MKKKLLSLVLAGAMVATTSVSAFAAATPSTTHKDTTIQEGTDSKEVPVEITGNVLDTNGNARPGTINVSVPTATTFSVNATTGALTSAQMTIRNDGDQKIKVIASKFEDSNGDDNIKVVKKTTFETQEATGTHNDRGTIWLRLKGATNNLGLTSEDKGTMYDNDYADKKTAQSNYELGEISGNGGNMTLELEGKGGVTPTDTKPNDTPIQDNFKLVLKIARAQ